jgi:hypothetical protein
MKPLAEDTSIEVERIQMEILRRMTPGQKMDRVRDLTMTAAEMQYAAIKRQRPDASDEEIRLRVISRWLPRELMIRAYNWDPAEHGY